MAETPDETRREIEETRLKIAEAVEELEERIDEARDWHRLVNKYPLESVAAALGAGFILSAGLLFRPRRRQTGERPKRSSAGVLAWIRPVLTPVITAQVMGYMRGRSEKQQKAA